MRMKAGLDTMIIKKLQWTNVTLNNFSVDFYLFNMLKIDINFLFVIFIKSKDKIFILFLLNLFIFNIF